jgi:hypothetical protein
LVVGSHQSGVLGECGRRGSRMLDVRDGASLSPGKPAVEFADLTGSLNGACQLPSGPAG